MVLTMQNCGDAAVMILQSIYYIFCKDWLYVHLFGIGASVFIIAIVMVFVPESPKFLYANKRFDAARFEL